MNRFPQPAAGFTASGRPNGFRHRIIMPVAGSYERQLPAGAPRSAAGLVLVKAVLLGGGQSGKRAADASTTQGGKGGAYAEKLWEVRPSATITAVVGAAGSGSHALGGNTTLTLDEATIVAPGGGQATSPTGGDVHHAGGLGRPTAAGSSGGGSAGQPWGLGVAATSSAGACWTQPQFWDLDDPMALGLMTPGADLRSVATWYSPGASDDFEADDTETSHGQGTMPRHLGYFAPVWGLGHGGGPGNPASWPGPGPGGGGGADHLSGGGENGEDGGAGWLALYF